MVIQTTANIIPHWDYFLSIERNVVEASRYVEFDRRNFQCFSIELAKILLSTGAETDVICKQICRVIDPNSNADNIHKYRDQIKPAYPKIPQFTVTLPRFGLTLHPWDEWNKSDGIPVWWTAYNKVKHNRDSHYDRADLQNVLNAVGGLLALVLYLYREQVELAELDPLPELFNIDEYLGTPSERWPPI